jgi:hypothetical protein
MPATLDGGHETPPSLPPDKKRKRITRGNKSRLSKRADSADTKASVKRRCKVLDEVRRATSVFDALRMSPGERSRAKATYLDLRLTMYQSVRLLTCWRLLAACAYTSSSRCRPPMGGGELQRPPQEKEKQAYRRRLHVRDVVNAFSLGDRTELSKGMRLLARARMLRPIDAPVGG